MILEGFSVDGEDNSVPRDAKVTDPSTSATKSISGFARCRCRIVVPAIQTIVVIAVPNIAPDRISPMIILSIRTGRDTNRSKVFSRFSHGVIKGPVEDAEKKSIMPRKLGKKSATSRFRPIKNVRNIMNGKSRPKITTDPLK
jgi:hypothetical protein